MQEREKDKGDLVQGTELFDVALQLKQPVPKPEQLSHDQHVATVITHIHTHTHYKARDRQRVCVCGRERERERSSRDLSGRGDKQLLPMSALLLQGFADTGKVHSQLVLRIERALKSRGQRCSPCLYLYLYLCLFLHLHLFLY